MGIDRYTALAASLPNPEDQPLVIAFDSKARSLYVQAFGPHLTPLADWPAEGRNLTAEEATGAMGGLDAMLAGDGILALLEAGLTATGTGVRTITAPMVAAAAANELAQGKTGWPPHPLYLAPPRAKLPKDGGRLRARAV